MRSRGSHVRVKVVALLASLVALWGFAAFVTLREGLNLLSVSSLDQHVGRPSESLVAELQQERRLTAVFLANRGADQRQAMISQRSRTADAGANFKRLAAGDAAKSSASPELNRRIADAITGLNALSRTRDAVDAGTLSRGEAAVAFTDVVTRTFRVYSALSTLDDPEIAREGRTLIALSRAQEILSQEDALVAGVLTVGRFTGNEHDQFVELTGAQRLLYDDAAADLPAADRDRYDQFRNGATFARFHTMEDLVIEKGRVGAPAPVDAQSWQAAVDPVFTDLRDFVLQAADGIVERAKPAVIGVFVRLGLAGGLGLLAVIASIVVSITTARSLIRQLEKLRTAAWELANERLPSVVDRLRQGEVVDVDAEAPPLTFGTDEIGQVGQAFNAVQKTAIKVAVEQAELRRGVRDVFLSLARRTQAQVHRQLAMLDAMERRETEPEELAALFRVDHLATRMRRNAENLIVLSGATAGRGWRHPVPLVDVVRGAVAEVEDYARITVLPINAAGLAGRAVGDVIHLLAELLENATSFSPPDTPVQVGGQKVANGFVIEIEDRGLGITEADLVTANEQLRNPPEFKLSGTVRLGLFVVGRLAMRHGIRVELRSSPYGGTMAIILIPSTLVVEDDGPDAKPVGSGRAAAAVTTRRSAANLLVRADRPLPRKPSELALKPALLLATEPPQVEPPQVEPPRAEPPRAEPPRAEPPRAEPSVAQPLPTRRAAEDRSPVELTGGEQTAGAPAGNDAVTPVTPNGLPRRVRQASLPTALAEGPTPLGDDAPQRAPEETRAMMASYQQQTHRGRTAAERSRESETARGDQLVDTGTGNNVGDR